MAYRPQMEVPESARGNARLKGKTEFHSCRVWPLAKINSEKFIKELDKILNAML